MQEGFGFFNSGENEPFSEESVAEFLTNESQRKTDQTSFVISTGLRFFQALSK